MPILREGGGEPIDFRNPRPQVWNSPDQATVNVVDTTATQTLTNKTITSPTLTSPTITSPTITNPTISGTTPVAVTASQVTLGSTHVGRVVVLNRATGIAVTLPAATGTGDEFKLFVKTTFTGASTVKVANTVDVMSGTAIIFQDAAATVVGFNTTADDDTIDLLGTSNSTGGIAGQTILLTDVASGVWSVELVSDGAGTEATPFSATV